MCKTLATLWRVGTGGYGATMLQVFGWVKAPVEMGRPGQTGGMSRRPG